MRNAKGKQRMFKNIVMVCIGNICRSPMAEAILRHRAQSKNISINISSAGIAALVGKPADSNVQELLLEEGIDCSAHKARQLTSAILLEAELVLVMEQNHRKEIECMFPNVCGKVHLLGKWGDFEVPDPYRKSREVFKDTHQLIMQGIDQWQARLWN